MWIWVAIEPKAKKILGIRGGISIGHYSVTAGTLGCFCKTVNGDIMIWSNNHVLADSNRGNRGDNIIQLGSLDFGNQSDVVANLDNFIPIDFTGKYNFVDAALAKPINSILIPQNPDILDIGKIRGIACNASIHTTIQKSVRITGHTKSNISGLNATGEELTSLA